MRCTEMFTGDYCKIKPSADWVFTMSQKKIGGTHIVPHNRIIIFMTDCKVLIYE